MKPAIKILYDVVILATLLVVVSLLVWMAPGDYNHDIAALINKRALLAAAPGRRVVFIGGSNLATLNSRRIHEGLHRDKKTDFSVVNMALWAGLSIRLYLEELKPYFKPGDRLIICQEYAPLLDSDFYDFIQKNEDAKLFFFLMSPVKSFARAAYEGRYSDSIKNIILLNQLKLKTYMQQLIEGKMKHRFTGGYYRYGMEYDEYGDRKRPFKILRPLNSAGVVFGGPVEKNLSYLKEFARWAERVNIQVYIAFPPFPIREYSMNKKSIETLEAFLSDAMGLTLLDRPQDAALPEDCFADTVFHLQPKCELIRTDRLVRRLNGPISGD